MQCVTHPMEIHLHPVVMTERCGFGVRKLADAGSIEAVRTGLPLRRLPRIVGGLRWSERTAVGRSGT